MSKKLFATHEQLLAAKFQLVNGSGKPVSDNSTISEKPKLSLIHGDLTTTKPKESVSS